MTAMAMETKERLWWVLLVQGAATFIIGAVLLWSPAKTQINTWLLLVQLLGIYWLIGGVMDLVHMFMDHTGWGWKLFSGLVGIAAGGWILMYPIAAAVVLPRTFLLVLGIWGVMQGIAGLVMAFRGGGWGMGILGTVGLFFGFVLIANYTAPGMGLALIWVAAVWAVIGGIAMMAQAFRQRSA
jgi:uncharacterized membrane protein HdeD (DUF308 family)